MQTAEAKTSRPALGGIVWGIVLNAIIPVVLYKLSKRYLSASEFTALVIATTFPLGKSIFDLARRGQVDPISIVVLLGIAVDGVAVLFGGSPRRISAASPIHSSNCSSESSRSNQRACPLASIPTRTGWPAAARPG
jgi:hypothetical protein